MSEEETNGERSPVQWAIDLLHLETAFDRSMIYRYHLVAGAGASTFAAGVIFTRLMNKSLKQYSAYIILSSLATTGVMYSLDKFFEYRSRRLNWDRINYMKTHPELFPEPPKIKCGELFLPWTPNR